MIFNKIISLSLIIGAVSILFLYSPLGSPDMYRASSYSFVAISQGVNFGGKIENSPRFSKLSRLKDDNQSFKMPEITQHDISTGSKKTGIYNSSDLNKNNNKVTTKSNRIIDAKKDVGFIASARSATTSSNNSTDNSTQTIVMQSLVNNMTSNDSRPAAAPAAPNDGGTDPGGDPEEPPIPVSDGCGILIVLAVGYTLLKIKEMKKRLT